MSIIKNYFKKFIKNNTSKKQIHYLDLPNFLLKDDDNSYELNPYSNNLVVHKCINLISTAVSHVPMIIWNKNAEHKLCKLKQHKALDLLSKPNSYSTGKDLLFGLVTNMLLHGNSYLLINNSKFDQKPCSIFLLNSQNVELLYNNNRLIGYKHITNLKENIYNIDPLDGYSKILHIKNHNPNHPFIGYKALKTAQKTLNLYDKILSWNISLLNNTANPSGTLSFKDHNDHLTEEQFQRLKEQFTDNFTGSANSGKPLILEGGLEWKELHNHKITENFLELKDSISRDIAMLFNIPPQLIGIKGDNTYSNMQEARLAFWEENIIPLLNKLSDSLTYWISYWFGEKLVISFDIDSISSLNEKRQNLWDKVSNASFMTLNEKRAVFNLPPIKNPSENTIKSNKKQ